MDIQMLLHMSLSPHKGWLFSMQNVEKKAKDWCTLEGNISYFDISAKKDDYIVNTEFL